MRPEMTTTGVGLVFSGWQDWVVSLGANATFTTGIGMQQTSAELPNVEEEPRQVSAQTWLHSIQHYAASPGVNAPSSGFRIAT